MPPKRHFAQCSYLLSLALSHFWFAMPQLVLHADWQEVWHSPQPPFFALSHRLRVFKVLICSILSPSIKRFLIYTLAYHIKGVNLRKRFLLVFGRFLSYPAPFPRSGPAGLYGAPLAEGSSGRGGGENRGKVCGGRYITTSSLFTITYYFTLLGGFG